MTKKEQPAQLKRRIALLEALLKAEQERSSKCFEVYRDLLYENVELKHKLQLIDEVMKGE